VVGHVTEVAEGVHRLTNRVANFYLIHEHDVQAARTGKVGPRDGKQSAYLLRGAF
jgi:hypothetical protein